LFLSTHEGFGFPPLEAMLHGCAVIASDIPVLHETLGELATFVDPTDSVKVAEGIDRAITSDSDVLRERRAIHAQSFQWKRHVVELGEVYREVLREPRVNFAQPPSA
jgi:glycosyltransferase involved in cell wall biosynthesis